jgi:hypothetical protein
MGFPNLVQTSHRKESNMDEQFELFESSADNWVSRLWKTVPAISRQEVLNLMAQMGQAALRAQKANAASQRKEIADEP